MTRLLLIGINYAPEATGIAPYTAALAEHLSGCGYAVTVVTGMPHYPAWRIDDAYRGRLRAREVRGAVDVRRRWHHVPRSPSIAGRGLYEAAFMATGLSSLLLPAPDAVIGVTPSLGGAVLARVAAKRFGAPYGVVVQDVVSGAVEQSGVGGRGLARAVAALEGWAMREASVAGVVAEGFRPRLEAIGVDSARIRRLRNWTRGLPATLDRAAVRARLGWPQNALVCLHAGNMGKKQGLEQIIECARLAAGSAPRLLFALVGDGNERARIEGLAARSGLANVRLSQLQPEELFASVLAAADVLLINQRASLADASLPSKLTSYVAAGRPVVAAAAAGSETAREVEASGSGVVVAPEDPAALLAALLRVTSDAALAARLGEAGARHARDVLSKEAALRGYEQFVAAVLASGGRGRIHAAGSPLPGSLDIGGKGRRAA